MNSAAPTWCSAISNAASSFRPGIRRAMKVSSPTRVPARRCRRAGIHAVGIANNVHYGETNILSSIARLDEYGVLHAGAGKDLAAARAPAIVERDGMRFGFLAAQLGVLADRSRGAQGRSRDRRHSRPHRLSRAGVQDAGRRAAAQPARRARRRSSPGPMRTISDGSATTSRRCAPTSTFSWRPATGGSAGRSSNT